MLYLTIAPTVAKVPEEKPKKVLGLLDFCGVTNVPKRMRIFDAQPWLVARLLLGSLLTFT